MYPHLFPLLHYAKLSLSVTSDRYRYRSFDRTQGFLNGSDQLYPPENCYSAHSSGLSVSDLGLPGLITNSINNTARPTQVYLQNSHPTLAQMVVLGQQGQLQS